ncbi:MAG TPA: BlaI/MecI/CopY family transcriptional regulator [Sumerlaeia bacterium]|nr:BlaI/MecI/CopY family transcriptional regulator [Sumerlaeia bacterium]
MSTLTRAELEMMRVLWEHGEMNPTQIQQKYPRPIKNAALRFQLKVLLGKGHVSRRKEGKTYYYQAVMLRQNVFREMTRRMSDAFCGGSAVGLIAELIRSEKLTPADVEEVKRFAETDRPPEASEEEEESPS